MGNGVSTEKNNPKAKETEPYIDLRYKALKMFIKDEHDIENIQLLYNERQLDEMTELGFIMVELNLLHVDVFGDSRDLYEFDHYANDIKSFFTMFKNARDYYIHNLGFIPWEEIRVRTRVSNTKKPRSFPVVIRNKLCYALIPHLDEIYVVYGYIFVKLGISIEQLRAKASEIKELYEKDRERFAKSYDDMVHSQLKAFKESFKD